MKICVLGNSHIAALKIGWDELAPITPAFDLRFFGSPRATLDALAVEGNELVPTDPGLAKNLEYTSGGQRRIVIGAYDAFLVHGLLFRLGRLDARLSNAVSKATRGDSYRLSLNFRIAMMIRSLTDAPIFIGHYPLTATTADPPRDSMEQSYAEVINFLNSAFSDDRLTFVNQPSATIDGGWATKAEYSKGSLRLETSETRNRVAHPDTDVSHMNGKFGELYLQEFFRLASLKM